MRRGPVVARAALASGVPGPVLLGSTSRGRGGGGFPTVVILRAENAVPLLHSLVPHLSTLVVGPDAGRRPRTRLWVPQTPRAAAAAINALATQVFAAPSPQEVAHVSRGRPDKFHVTDDLDRVVVVAITPDALSADVDCVGLVLSRLLANPPPGYVEAVGGRAFAAPAGHHKAHPFGGGLSSRVFHASSSRSSSRSSSSSASASASVSSLARGGDGDGEDTPGAGFELVGLKMLPAVPDHIAHVLVPLYGTAPKGVPHLDWRAATFATVSTGPVLVLALRRVNAVALLEDTVGPHRVLQARASAPNSLRALYVPPPPPPLSTSPPPPSMILGICAFCALLAGAMLLCVLLLARAGLWWCGWSVMLYLSSCLTLCFGGGPSLCCLLALAASRPRFGTSDSTPGVVSTVSQTRVFSILASVFHPSELAPDAGYHASATQCVPKPTASHGVGLLPWFFVTAPVTTAFVLLKPDGLQRRCLSKVRVWGMMPRVEWCHMCVRICFFFGDEGVGCLALQRPTCCLTRLCCLRLPTCTCVCMRTARQVAAQGSLERGANAPHQPHGSTSAAHRCVGVRGSYRSICHGHHRP